MLPSDLKAPLGATETARVLLVEPDDAHAQRIWRVLLKEGFTVTCLGSGEAALGTVEDLMPDLVVVCSELPGMTGGQLARRLRLDALTRTIPILMLTEDAFPGGEREGLESGADAYISTFAHPDLLVLRTRAMRRVGPELLRVDEATRFRRARIVIVTAPREEEDVGEITEDAAETTLEVG